MLTGGAVPRFRQRVRPPVDEPVPERRPRLIHQAQAPFYLLGRRMLEVYPMRTARIPGGFS
jgi:hypothetical protein